MLFRTIIRVFSNKNKENKQLSYNQTTDLVKLNLDKKSVLDSIEIIDLNRYTISNSFVRIEKAIIKTKPFVFIINKN